MLVHTSQMKIKKKLANDVICISATHTSLLPNITDTDYHRHEIAPLLATFCDFQTLSLNRTVC